MGLIFHSILVDLLALIVVFLLSIYVYINYYVYTHWKRAGIKYITPTFPFGNFGEAFKLKDHMGILMQKFYKSTSEPLIGIYTAFRPTVLICDPELIRTIFVKDFQHFHDRGFHVNENIDPLSGHLFSLSGDKWKNLRTKLTPTFTSGKLKAMFSSLISCAASLTTYMERAAAIEDVIEIRELLAQYTTNIIASVAFGYEIDCIDQPDVPFRKYGRKVFDPSLKNGLRGLLSFLFPKLLPTLHIKGIDQDITDFITNMVKQTLEYRENSNIIRRDFFQMMVQIRNTGSVSKDDDQWGTKVNKEKQMSINEMAAQSFVFFIAGFETSSSTMSYCLYELARNPACQAKAQKEIDEVLAKYDGILTYESISEMKYLDYCIDETLRMYPPLLTLNRECTKDWTVPNTMTVVKKGTITLIPAYAIHHDEKYYPNPEQFDPERFNAHNIAGKTFIDMPYMPFGEGPRICIGLRMGKMQSKVGLVLMLQHYNYHLAKNTLKPLEISPTCFVTTPIGGLHLKVTKRNK